MTIDKATKLQEELLHLLPEVGFNKYMASTRLGIEALEQMKAERTIYGFKRHNKMPSETEE